MNPQQNQDFNHPQPTQPPSVIPSAQSPMPPPSMDPTVPAPAPMPPPKSNRTRLLLIIAILILLGGGAAAYFVTKNNNDKNKDIGGSVSLNGNNAATTACVPIISNSPDLNALATTYERFAKGVAAKNQTCADSLSTSYFLSHVKQKFGAPDGKWAAYKIPGTGRESMSDDFSQLPSTLVPGSFKQTAYTRATVVGENNPSATGTTLSYPVDLSKYTGDGSKWQISISIIIDNGNLKVDDLIVEPQT